MAHPRWLGQTSPEDWTLATILRHHTLTSPPFGSLVMTSPDRPHLWKSKFAVAFSGLFRACRTQSSMQVHVVCGVSVVTLAWVSGLAPAEWAVLLLAIGLVIGLELVNTSLEAIIDHVSPEHSEWARVAKDAAAAAVLVGAMMAAGVGLCVFLPHWGPWIGL